MKSSPLKADPAKIRAFLRRSQGKGLKRGNGLAHKPTRPRATTPRAVLALVMRRDKGCVACAHEGSTGPMQDPHHLLPKRRWAQYVGEPGNIVMVCRSHHADIEFSPRYKLPWEALPDECQRFLEAVCKLDGQAARHVRVNYPRNEGAPAGGVAGAR